MILPPVGNKGEGFFLLDSIQGGLDRHRVKPDRLGRLTDAQQGPPSRVIPFSYAGFTGCSSSHNT